MNLRKLPMTTTLCLALSSTPRAQAMEAALTAIAWMIIPRIAHYEKQPKILTIQEVSMQIKADIANRASNQRTSKK